MTWGAAIALPPRPAQSSRFTSPLSVRICSVECVPVSDRLTASVILVRPARQVVPHVAYVSGRGGRGSGS